MFYKKKKSFQYFYFKILCLIQCITCHFFIIICVLEDGSGYWLFGLSVPPHQTCDKSIHQSTHNLSTHRFKWANPHHNGTNPAHYPPNHLFSFKEPQKSLHIWNKSLILFRKATDSKLSELPIVDTGS